MRFVDRKMPQKSGVQLEKLHKIQLFWSKTTQNSSFLVEK
jgi:hypothetical protein